MVKQFDVIVIGTGPSGSAIARKCSENGLQVAITDTSEYGGTCPLKGCNPKKVLASAAALIDQNKRMTGKGIDSEASIDWKALVNFKQVFTDPVPNATEKGLKKAGVEIFHGQAMFLSEKEIQINDQILLGNKIVIATGADPIDLAIKGEEHFTYSDDFLELNELPKKVVFVGGGYISFEFAHIAARAGSEVHIIQRGEHPLKAFDPDLVDRLIQKSLAIGITVHLNTTVKAIDKKTNGFIVQVEKNNKTATFDGDVVIHGGGRAPNVSRLNLERGKVSYKKAGVTVNEYLQSVSNPNVYAAGDVVDTAGAPLTPVAQLEAEVVVNNITYGNKCQADYLGIPSVVFTTPKLATVGMSEQQAERAGYNVDVNHSDLSEWFTYKHTNDQTAAVKIMIDQNSGHILGAHLLSGKADDLINIFAMAIQLKLTTNEMKQVTYAFPTAVSDIPSML